MADEPRHSDATVVVGVAPVDEATVLLDRKPAATVEPAAATVVAAPVAAATAAAATQSQTTGQSGSISWSGTAGLSQRVAAAPVAPSRPTWLAVALGVACGLALFAATALVLLRA